ncbi:MerR family transcriptional regulator [Isoptericola halotolerans]|uniref:MerR family transcriptional regulator n=1 Tax=Isoptericola halotolerans TaxID=300560 RepID=UPI00388F4C6F
MTTPQTMHIGAVADRTGLSLRTLRHYDQVGLLPPSARSEGGFRLYTESDVERLLLIRRMKPLGFSLEEMADLLAVADRLGGGPDGTDVPDGEEEALRARLARHVAAAQERRAALARRLDMADELISLLREL